jgi:hypothetical protein
VRRLAIVVATAALCVSTAPVAEAGAAGFEEFGIASVSAELSTNLAGAHPDFTTTLELKTDPASTPDATGQRAPYALVKDVRVELPPGLLANLNAVQTCSAVQFVTGATGQGCPFGSQVGVAVIHAGLGFPLTVSIFNLETAGEDEVARLGFFAHTVPAIVRLRLRSDSDYGVVAETVGISSVVPLQAMKTTLWGDPSSSTHDTQRLTIQESINGKTESPARSSGREPVPFMTNPTACGASLEVDFAVSSYQEPTRVSRTSAPLGEVVGCPGLSFEPSVSLVPTSREAAAPSGADVALKIPQNEAVNGRVTSQLRNTVVRLPEGVTIATGAADGLDSCSAAQVGYKVSPPGPAHCPDAAKIAAVEIDSPSLSRPLQGAVYQRTPEPGRPVRAWLVADDLGVHLKLPGEFELDPGSGRITSLFLEAPQLPLRRLELHFKGGARGALATPSACGTYRTAYKLTPWSGGADVEGETPMTFDRSCGNGGFDPQLSAGTVNPSAARFSPFVADLTRGSGEQNLAGLRLTLPPGVVAKLAGVEICPDADAATGRCSAASQVGRMAVAVGPGASPLWIPQPGREPMPIYLAGPFKGAPYSLVIRAAVQAGPFDLGTVVVRAAIRVDPDTARISVISDPLPQLLEGIPVSYRRVHVDIDRPRFTLNPTSCDPMQVTGTATSALGAETAVASRFQVGSCAGLGFKPKLRLRFLGGTGRNAHPALRATLKMPRGGANIARARVMLPPSQLLENAHIRTICTRVRFAAGSCPRAAIYGYARAFTPLLDRPLEGPVYLRSSGHELPDLVADLGGEVDIAVDGRVDSVGGGMGIAFTGLPDVPISKFVLSMQGGRKGLLVNSRDLCAGAYRATVQMDGQNGKVHDFKAPLHNDCDKRK